MVARSYIKRKKAAENETESVKGDIIGEDEEKAKKAASERRGGGEGLRK